jgi:hypothetical protein
MERFYRATMKIGGGTLFGRLAFGNWGSLRLFKRLA